MPDLPTELWGRIFALGVHDDLRFLPTLLAINHTFQSIANGTPQLWTRLVFYIKNGQIDNRYTQARLQRSGVLLALDIRIFSYNTTYAQASELATLLRRQAARIRTLELNVPEYTIAEKILAKIGRNQSAPLLERLHIFYNQGTYHPIGLESPPELSLENVFPSSPRLTHLDLTADPLPSIDSLPLFSTVTTVTLDTNISIFEISIHQIVGFLSRLPRLKHFKFKGVGHDFQAMDFLHQTLPHLLSVDVTVPGYGFEILRNFTAPSLTTMRFDGRRCTRMDWDPGLANTFVSGMYSVAAGFRLVTRLEFVSTKLPNYRWIISGDAFPALRVLRLEDTDITDDVLRYCNNVCRNLKRLEFLACQELQGPGLISFVLGLSEDFELLLDSCPNISQAHVVTLSTIVKVETASNAFSDRLQAGSYFYPWEFTWQ